MVGINLQPHGKGGEHPTPEVFSPVGQQDARHYERQVGDGVRLGVVPSLQDDEQVGGQPEHQGSEQGFFPSGAQDEHQHEKAQQVEEHVVRRAREKSQRAVEVFDQVVVEVGRDLVIGHPAEHAVGPVGVLSVVLGAVLEDLLRAAGKLLDVALYQDFPGENRVEVRQGQQREEHDAAQDGQILFEGFLTG